MTDNDAKRNKIALILNAAATSGALDFFIEIKNDRRFPQEIPDSERRAIAHNRAQTFDEMANQLEARGLKL